MQGGIPCLGYVNVPRHFASPLIPIRHRLVSRFDLRTTSGKRSIVGAHSSRSKRGSEEERGGERDEATRLAVFLPSSSFIPFSGPSLFLFRSVFFFLSCVSCPACSMLKHLKEKERDLSPKSKSR